MKFSIRTGMIIPAVLPALCLSGRTVADTTVATADHTPRWSIGAEISPAFVAQTGRFLRGDNPCDKQVRASLSGALKAEFRYAPTTKDGMLYPGLYQGLGLGLNTFFAPSVMGTPATAYVYQGAPLVRFGSRLSLGYEWRFGAAIGWKPYDIQEVGSHAPISTRVTAMMGVGLRLDYALTDRCTLSFGITGTHFSNGNTSLPNGGVNTVGASAGFTYALYAPYRTAAAPQALVREADRGRWFCDIVIYGAWRKRVTIVDDPPTPQLVPGVFPVAGFQLAPMRKFNRHIAVGPAVDVLWDHSSGLAPYWLEGSYGDDVKFYRPPFRKQLSIGLSAHAELITPIFAVNAGLGYDFMKPHGDKRFYQSLTLKTFMGRHFFINVGYRLADFRQPQNLMLGLGLRL